MRQAKTTRRKVAIWSVFLLFCASAGGLRLWQTRSLFEAQRRWEAQQAQLSQRNMAAYERLGRFLEHPSLKERKETMQREQLEQVLGLPAPLQSRAYGRGVQFIYLDAATDGYVFLSMWKDGLGGYGACSTNEPPCFQPKPMAGRLDRMTEHVRCAIAGSDPAFPGYFGLGDWGLGGYSFPYFSTWYLSTWQRLRLGPVVWIGLLPLLLLPWRYRPRLAELMLAVAILFTVAWLVDPARPLRWESFAYHEVFPLAPIMLLFSATNVIIVGRPSRPPYPACDSCGYNLTGNVSGVCPECGTPVMNRPAGPGMAVPRSPAGSAGVSSDGKRVPANAGLNRCAGYTLQRNSARTAAAFTAVW
jgi:hypothetical protein